MIKGEADGTPVRIMPLSAPETSLRGIGGLEERLLGRKELRFQRVLFLPV